MSNQTANNYRRAAIQVAQLYWWALVLLVLAVPAFVQWCGRTYGSFADAPLMAE